MNIKKGKFTKPRGSAAQERARLEADFKRMTQSAGGRPDREPAGAQEPEARRKKRLKITAISVAAVLAVVVLGLSFFLWSYSRDDGLIFDNVYALNLNLSGMTQEQAEKAVPIGTPIVYRGSCFARGESQVCGKAMDDRACFVTLLRCAELLRDKELDVDLYIMGSTREEVSGAGATTGTFAIAPDYCVAVDVTHGKTPDVPNPRGRVLELGGGPAVGIGPNMTTWMTRRMIAKAESNDIPWQGEVMAGHTGTNGWHVQVSREGVATSVVSLPLKYMHTPIEVLTLEDIESVAKLLAAFTENLGKEAETIC